MGSTCSKCGADINDHTIDCPNCGHRVKEERLESRCKIAEGAIRGWRNKVDTLKLKFEELRLFTCEQCQDYGPCDDCPAHKQVEAFLESEA